MKNNPILIEQAILLLEETYTKLSSIIERQDTVIKEQQKLLKELFQAYQTLANKQPDNNKYTVC